MKFAIVSVAGLAMAATASAQSLNIGGQTYDAADGIAPLGSINSSGSVTDVEFDVAINAGNFGENISWGSEFNLQIDGPGGEQFIAGGPGSDLSFGWGDSSGTFSFSGSAPFSGGAGEYTVSVFDTFDDAGTDGFIFEGSTVTLIPTPGAAAILGMGGLVATRRRR